MVNLQLHEDWVLSVFPRCIFYIKGLVLHRSFQPALVNFSSDNPNRYQDETESA